jgi:hypothetical protein
MSLSNVPVPAGQPSAGRYLVQLAAPNDPPPSGQFAVEPVARRNADDRVQAEFAVCVHLDLVRRDLRTNDRVHAMQRYRGRIRSLVRRVEVTPSGNLLYPTRNTRGRKAKPIHAADVVVAGLVTGTFTQFRV